jgi:hypothetical protein
MHYSDSDVSGLVESNLEIYRYNEDTSSWQVLENCSVNTTSNIVTCKTKHFSTFGIFTNVSAPASTVRHSS